ncbi:hypothetical protein OPQ81_003472 [Rhizoctonia solani]|nr:hypothetical protein OPQ81_003472 [Rhizoctonia solani]
MIARTIALAGANGYTGQIFAKELLKQGLELRILARDESIGSAALQEFMTNGASIHAISYDDEASLVKALQGADVLISTVSGAALVSAQIPLIKAAKRAQVKLFVPSEYAGPYKDESSPFAQLRKTVFDAVQDVGLPCAVLSNGGFPERCLTPTFGYDFAERKVTLWGDGNSKVSWTTARSVGDWIANVLKTIPIGLLQDKHFCIQGKISTANEIIDLWQKKYGAKLQVDYRPMKELDDRIEADKDGFLAPILKELYSGGVEVGGKDNSLYPDWEPESLEAIL